MTIKPGSLTVVINDVTYRAEYASIAQTLLGIEDHGLFTYMLDLHFGGGSSGQGFGMRTPADWKLTLLAILNVVGVDQWERLTGKPVFALYDTDPPRGTILGILSVDQRKAFLPGNDQEYVYS